MKVIHAGLPLEAKKLVEDYFTSILFDVEVIEIKLDEMPSFSKFLRHCNSVEMVLVSNYFYSKCSSEIIIALRTLKTYRYTDIEALRKDLVSNFWMIYVDMGINSNQSISSTIDSIKECKVNSPEQMLLFCILQSSFFTLKGTLGNLEQFRGFNDIYDKWLDYEDSIANTLGLLLEVERSDVDKIVYLADSLNGYIEECRILLKKPEEISTDNLWRLTHSLPFYGVSKNGNKYYIKPVEKVVESKEVNMQVEKEEILEDKGGTISEPVFEEDDVEDDDEFFNNLIDEVPDNNMYDSFQAVIDINKDKISYLEKKKKEIDSKIGIYKSVVNLLEIQQKSFKDGIRDD